jgi:hypothetical protein
LRSNFQGSQLARPLLGVNISIGSCTLTTARASGGSGTTVKGAVTSRAKNDPVGTATGGGTNVQAVGGNSSGDGKTTAAVDGNEGPADATNDNKE